MAGVPTNKIAIRIDRIFAHASSLENMVENSNEFFNINDAIVRAQEIEFHAKMLLEDMHDWLNEGGE